MEGDINEDSPIAMIFPVDLLKEVRIPKHKSGAYTDAEKRAIF